MRFTPSVGASTAILLASAAAAFKDSSPLLVWSSQSNDALAEAAAELTSGVISADAVFGSLASIGCDWDAAVVVHMDDLHESQLQDMSLPYGKRKADLHIPYLIRPNVDSLDSSVQAWASQCGADMVDKYQSSSADRQLLYLHAQQDAIKIPSDLPENHIVVLTGTREVQKGHADRAGPASESVASPLQSETPEPTASEPAKKHSAYFTEPIISGLIVSFFVFLPILFIGLYSLSSIQVPPRMMEINKTQGVNKQRKDQ